MENRDMVRMANQIAEFFTPYPRSEALQGVANHIKNFWEPRMREQLRAYIAAGADGLLPLVVEAVQAKPGAPASTKGNGRPSTKRTRNTL